MIKKAKGLFLTIPLLCLNLPFLDQFKSKYSILKDFRTGQITHIK